MMGGRRKSFSTGSPGNFFSPKPAMVSSMVIYLLLRDEHVPNAPYLPPCLKSKAAPESQPQPQWTISRLKPESQVRDT